MGALSRITTSSTLIIYTTDKITNKPSTLTTHFPHSFDCSFIHSFNSFFHFQFNYKMQQNLDNPTLPDIQIDHHPSNHDITTEERVTSLQKSSKGAVLKMNKKETFFLTS